MGAPVYLGSGDLDGASETIEAVWRAFGIEAKDSDYSADYRLPDAILRETDYLTHPVFHMNRAESEMMRYMRRLADRDCGRWCGTCCVFWFNPC